MPKKTTPRLRVSDAVFRGSSAATLGAQITLESSPIHHADRGAAVRVREVGMRDRISVNGTFSTMYPKCCQVLVS